MEGQLSVREQNRLIQQAQINQAVETAEQHGAVPVFPYTLPEGAAEADCEALEARLAADETSASCRKQPRSRSITTTIPHSGKQS